MLPSLHLRLKTTSTNKMIQEPFRTAHACSYHFHNFFPVEFVDYLVIQNLPLPVDTFVWKPSINLMMNKAVVCILASVSLQFRKASSMNSYTSLVLLP